MGLEKVGTIIAWARNGESLLTATRRVFNPKEFIIILKGNRTNKIARYIRDGQNVGEIRYGITSSNTGKYPDYYLQNTGTKLPTIKPSIFIQHLEGKKCGTELMQVACHDAVKLTEGRMVLDAQCVDGLTTPDAFYYKLGFRKLSSKENEMIQKYIDKGETIPPDTFSDRMFLPRENVTKLLNYRRK